MNKRNLRFYLLSILGLFTFCCGSLLTIIPVEASNRFSISITPADSTSSSTTQQSADSIEEMFEDHLNSKPSLLITCTACNGTGYLDFCTDCNGTGRKLLSTYDPSIALFTPCRSCSGEGYISCAQCLSGSMINPDYQEEMEIWTERKHELLGLMGYTAEDIKRMENAEAQAILDSYTPMSDSFSSINEYSSTPSSGICKQCYGTGNCHTCGGDCLYQNMFTGEQLTCPNCTDGTCRSCRGTGQAK